MEGAIKPAEDVVYGIFHEHNGTGYVLDAHTYDAPARALISQAMLIPFGMAVTAFVGFCDSSGRRSPAPPATTQLSPSAIRTTPTPPTPPPTTTRLSWGYHGKYFLREAKLWGHCDW